MNIHFIGIGGIGVSALAHYELSRGNTVSGSDLTESEITKALREKGAMIQIGEGKVPEDTERVVFSPAVQADHEERQEASKRQIPQMSYPEALGELTKTHYTVAISGTHGKSTTTAMIGILLTKAGLDPTVIVGTKLKEFGNTNCRVGKGQIQGKSFGTAQDLRPLLVIEADEYAESFLHYYPDVIVLTSLEADHLDYYKTFENVTRAFTEYLSHLDSAGIIVANGDDANIRTLVEKKERVHFTSLSQKEAETLKRILKIPGAHNVSNALAALETARILGVPDEISTHTLSEYTGSWRRFEVFALKDYTLVSDYGHHPTEVQVTVEAAREKWPEKKLWLVFQPHQYDRTWRFFDDFARILSGLPVHKLLLAPIYDVAGRENTEAKAAVSSEKLLHAIQQRSPKAEEARAFSTLEETEMYVREHIQGGEIVIIMGAGNIYSVACSLIDRSSQE
ncbi:MAG: UDP-N-acetylmuramate--L-alanine ligase [Candidatus Yanofskybacteria bacterium]|nr:UDP-N-acetylmuramate--L-alanine ligase [Candidatus Yanofskybacteria bacterium]